MQKKNDVDINSLNLCRQVFFVLITVSAGLIFGRILATDNIPDRAIQNVRLKNYLNDKKKELAKKELSPEQTEKRLEEYQQYFLQRENIERPFHSANDRSRWGTIRALVEPESRVVRFVPLKNNSGDSSKYVFSEIMRNCDCVCPQHWMTADDKNTIKNSNINPQKKYVKEIVWFALDKVMENRAWDTIDMVKHGLPDEIYDPANPYSGYLYSSKPNLLPTLMAVPYWILFHSTGLSLSEHPFLVSRILLVVINLIPLIVSWFFLGRMIERFAKTNWGRFFAMSVVCFATFMSTFAVTLNNHVPGFVCVVLSLYGGMRILLDNERKARYFVMSGFFGALAVACELPLLAYAFLLCFILLLRVPRRTLLIAVPLGLIVADGFLTTNYWAHRTILPAYAQKRDHVRLQNDLNEQNKQSELNKKEELNKQSEINRQNEQNKQSEQVGQNQQNKVEPQKTSELSFSPDDWYVYRYFSAGKPRNNQNVRLAYWANRTGIDRGEESIAVYAFHASFGHHGIFSLTPVWILSFIGIGQLLLARKSSKKRSDSVVFQQLQSNGLASKDSSEGNLTGQNSTKKILPQEKLSETEKLRIFAVCVLGLSVLFFVFYLMRDQGDRNYGGMTSGLRWMFPMIPLWTLTLLPVLDGLSRFRVGRGLALVLLFLSAVSVAYPLWNPWSNPWLYDMMVNLGWVIPF